MTLTDKEKLEAIKKVLDNIALISSSENYFEKALVEITKILDGKAFQMNDNS